MNDIFESDCEAIVNTVNCVGVMGGGLAAQFRRRYPDMNTAYQRVCARGEMRIGRMWQWHDARGERWLINFPTKLDWRNPSELAYVDEGLADLRRVIADLKLTSIAVPALGCGLGGLKWEDVEPLIHRHLGGLGTRVDIYPPHQDKYTLQQLQAVVKPSFRQYPGPMSQRELGGPTVVDSSEHINSIAEFWEAMKARADKPPWTTAPVPPVNQ